jgi:hypothetical protein
MIQDGVLNKNRAMDNVQKHNICIKLNYYILFADAGKLQRKLRQLRAVSRE